jgi:hypothetical protein
MDATLAAYDAEFERCARLFLLKTADYGTAWRILRPASLTDQLFIKANRIRTLQETGVSKVGEGIVDEFVGIVNYGLLALVQLSLPGDAPLELQAGDAERLYCEAFRATRELMQRKNHDYGEAWRDMRVGSLVDLILMKVLRVKQIEDAGGATRVSEGVEANYMDMVNYALFALILISESRSESRS